MIDYLLTFLILSAVMVVRYFLLSGFFSLISKNAVSQDSHQRNRDIKWSLLSSIVFAISGVLILWIWENGLSEIYLDFSDYPVWYLFLSLFIYLFIHDSYFYWTHRLMHRYHFKLIHFAHHESCEPTAWTSFAFHPYEAIIQAAILPLLILAIPVHISVLGIYLLLMSLFGVTNHLGHELYSTQISEKYSIITATHHSLHHRYPGYNFGLYFSWWDKWMGTERT